MYDSPEYRAEMDVAAITFVFVVILAVVIVYLILAFCTRPTFEEAMAQQNLTFEEKVPKKKKEKKLAKKKSKEKDDARGQSKAENEATPQNSEDQAEIEDNAMNEPEQPPTPSQDMLDDYFDDNLPSLTESSSETTEPSSPIAEPEDPDQKNRLCMTFDQTDQPVEMVHSPLLESRKKKKKKKNKMPGLVTGRDVNDSEMSTDRVLCYLRSATMNEEELEEIMDILSDKESYTGQWLKQRNDPVPALKRQIREKDEALEMNQNLLISTNERLKHVRVELVQQTELREIAEKQLSERSAQTVVLNAKISNLQKRPSTEHHFAELQKKLKIIEENSKTIKGLSIKIGNLETTKMTLEDNNKVLLKQSDKYKARSQKAEELRLNAEKKLDECIKIQLDLAKRLEGSQCNYLGLFKEKETNAARISLLEKENFDLRVQLDEDAQKHSERQKELQQEIQEKEKEIGTLKREVAAFLSSRDKALCEVKRLEGRTVMLIEDTQEIFSKATETMKSLFPSVVVSNLVTGEYWLEEFEKKARLYLNEQQAAAEESVSKFQEISESLETQTTEIVDLKQRIEEYKTITSTTLDTLTNLQESLGRAFPNDKVFQNFVNNYQSDP